MSEFFDLLNRNSGALSAVFSFVVTIATVIYAWLTAKLVKETRQMREAQTEPRIQVTYRLSEFGTSFLNIAVRNIGLGPAHDIKFNVSCVTNLPGTVELSDELMKMACFQKGLVYLGPNEEYTSFWTGIADNESKINSQLIIEAKYRSFTGTHYGHNCTIDLSDLKGARRLGEPPLITIAHQLKELARDIHRITHGSHKTKVDVYTKADREKESARQKGSLPGSKEAPR